MREILYRVWDKNNKKMIYAPGEFDSSLGKALMTLDGRIYINGKYQNLVFMQYTGLLDCTGKKIYEGDVVRDGYGLLIVFYQAPSFIMKRSKKARTWYVFDLAPHCNQFQEVIGNIYENKNLLKEIK